MVRHMPNQSEQLTQVFSALADPTRRAVLARFSEGPCPTTSLRRPFKVGRVRTYELAPQRLEAAEHWLSTRRQE